MDIWNKLPKPFFVLAPMDDVTDTVFRQVIAECAAPDVYFTEFINVDALQSKGREATLRRLMMTNKEHPLIVQIWGLRPENFYKTAIQIADGSLVEETNCLFRDSDFDEVQGNKRRGRSRINNTAIEGQTQLTPQFAKSNEKVSSFTRKQASTAGFSGVDINMGCPEKRVVKNGACAALMLPENESRAIEIIQATREGLNFAASKKSYVAPELPHVDTAQGSSEKRNEAYEMYDEENTGADNEAMRRELIRVSGSAGEQGSALRSSGATPLPLSVKTRLGFKELDMRFHEALLGQKLNVLSIHGRTRNQMSKVPADWDAIGKIREMRDELFPATKIVGNGDVLSRQEGEELAKKHGLDGIMIGRGVFHDPFVFSSNTPWQKYTKVEKIALYRRHVELFIKTYYPEQFSDTDVNAVKDGSVKRHERTAALYAPRIHTLNKFCKIYINGFDGAKELRDKLMHAGSAEKLLNMLSKQV